VNKILGEDWSWEAGSAGSGWSTIEKEKNEMNICDGVNNNDVNHGGSTRLHEGPVLGSSSGGSSTGVNNNNHNDNHDDNNSSNSSSSSSNNAITNVKKAKVNPVDDKETPRKMRRSIAMRNAKFNQSGILNNYLVHVHTCICLHM
jgi:hypothetical protein